MAQNLSSEPTPVIGVLAIQGSFREHVSALKRIGATAVEVRKPEELRGLAGLIIPGGESTTMANIAQRNGLATALQEFCGAGKPTWGTCAGLIFLSERAIGQKSGGQALLGGLDCTVHRNFFGSQVNSFEAELAVPRQLAELGGPDHFRAVFIRAPAVVETGAHVEVLVEYRVPPGTSTTEYEKVAVAVKQGPILATAFHPELTSDTRWHQLFVQMVSDKLKSGEITTEAGAHSESSNAVLRSVNRPADLPVFGGDKVYSIERDSK